MSSLTTAQTKTDQVTEFLEQEILSGRLKPGDRLHSMRELGNRFQVSTIVVNAAYDTLEKKNLVLRCGRRGVFVTDPAQQATRLLLVEYETLYNKEAATGYIIPEFEATCRERHVEVDRLMVSFLKGANTAETLDYLRSRNYRGVLLANCTYTGAESEVKLLQELDIPVLIPHSRPEDLTNTGFSVFYSENEKAWSDAIEFLKQQGFRRIGALGIYNLDGDASLRCESNEKHAELMARQGLSMDPNGICCIPYRENEEFQQGLEKWLTAPLRFDAILCYSDFVALRLYEFCRAHGIRIPEDLAIMGFCGYPGGELLQPPLSTIDMQYTEIGKRAAEYLIRARNPRSPEAVPTPYKLIARGSTARKK